MKRLLGLLAVFFAPVVAISAVQSHNIRIVPLANGDLDFNTPDGAAASPSVPQIGQPVPVSDTAIDFSIATLSTGGTAPIIYEIQCSTTGAQGAYTVIASGDLFATNGIYNWTSASAETAYHCRPIAEDDDGDRSGFGGVWPVTTPAAGGGGDSPSTPGDITYSNVSSVGFTLSWTASTDTEDMQSELRYGFGCGEGDGMGSPANPTNWLWFAFDDYDGLSYDWSDAVEGQEYYCRVRAKDTDGNLSGASDPTYETTEATPAGNIIFSWDHESEPTGIIPSGDLTGGGGIIWRKSVTTDANSNLEIIATDPLCSGCNKYMHAYAQKSNGAIYRTERYYFGDPSHDPMNDLGSGNYDNSGDDFWYGFLWRLDAYPANEEHVHLHQFWQQLAPPPQDQSANPQMTVRFNAEDLTVYIEQNDDASSIVSQVGGGGLSGAGSLNYISPILDTDIVGKCYRIIWNVNWDTRTAAEGSAGAVALYLNDNATPVFSYSGLQALQDDQEGQFPMFTWGTYLSAWRYSPSGDNGQAYAASMDNFVVMDETGSYAAMAAAIGACD